jgi:hypothetical protein
MKGFFVIVGAIHCALFVLGGLNFIDYYVCIKEAGKCTIAKELK